MARPTRHSPGTAWRALFLAHPTRFERVTLAFKAMLQNLSPLKALDFPAGRNRLSLLRMIFGEGGHAIPTIL